MRFSADCSFHIGAQHLRSGMPCQDYAVSLTYKDMDSAVVVVSDGCSSGGKTDVGARITALSWLHVASPFVVGRQLGLKVDDLLATRLTIQASPPGAFVRVCGDGVVAEVDRDGHLRMWRMDWVNNMPCYPAYADDDFESFIAAHGGNENAFHIQRWADVGVGLHQEASLTKGTSPDFLKLGHIIRTPAERLRAIAIFSDGVTQVEGMPWQEVVADLMNFRSTAGDFVKRRMNKFLKDHRPVDDIAMAAILVHHEG